MNHNLSAARPFHSGSDDALPEGHLLALAAEAAEVGLWWFDPVAERLDGNTVFREILLGQSGRDDHPWPLAGGTLLGHVHPEDRERIRNRVRALLSNGTGARFEESFRLRHSKSDDVVRVIAAGKVILPEASDHRDRTHQPYLAGTIRAHSRDDQSTAGMVTDRARLEAILNTMPQMVWSARPDGYHDYYNDRWYEFTGVPYGSTDGEAWNGMFHPDDQARAWERWRQSLATGEPYEIEYRLRRHDGEYRWTLGRALPIRRPDGTIERWFGTCTDIHDLKTSEEQRELISRELSHRIKNIFAVVSSLVALASRKDEAVRPFATALVQRLNSLAHVHAYIQPHNPLNEADPASRTVLGLLRILAHPYMHEQDGQSSSDDARLAVAGDDAQVGAGAGTALALIIHELATNAVKYGSLSRPEGYVTIRGELLPDDQFRLTWQERGGPPVQGPPAHRGFGTVLADRGATGQLGARMEQDWDEAGLIVRLTMPVENLTR